MLWLNRLVPTIHHLFGLQVHMVQYEWRENFESSIWSLIHNHAGGKLNVCLIKVIINFILNIIPISSTCSEADLVHFGHGKRYTSTYGIPAALAFLMFATALGSTLPVTREHHDNLLVFFGSYLVINFVICTCLAGLPNTQYCVARSANQFENFANQRVMHICAIF